MSSHKQKWEQIVKKADPVKYHNYTKKQKITLEVTVDQLNHITAALNNESLRWIDFAMDNFDNSIENHLEYEECMSLSRKYRNVESNLYKQLVERFKA